MFLELLEIAHDTLPDRSSLSFYPIVIFLPRKFQLLFQTFCLIFNYFHLKTSISND